MVSLPHRRRVLAGLAASVFVPQTLHANSAVMLDWDDLLPEGTVIVPNALRALIEHDESLPVTSEQPASTGLRPDWNGQTVEMAGFIVPIDFQGTGVTAFLLVPYVGACVHVPPPPANQLVLVTTERPYESDGLFAPVTVTGMFGVSETATHLANVGYAMSADKIERYKA